MLCKDIKTDYRRLKSIESGLLHKIIALDKLISDGNLILLDRLLTEQTETRETLNNIDKQIKHIERDFKFINKEDINDLH